MDRGATVLKIREEWFDDLAEPVHHVPFEKQQEFIRAVLSGKYLEIMYAGAAASGKTWALGWAVLALCRMFPGSRWAVVRKDHEVLKHFKQDFEIIRPRYFCGRALESTGSRWASSVCRNGSQIIWFPESSSAGDTDMNRFRGFNVNGFFFEEANECFEKTWNMALLRAGRHIVPGLEKQPPIVVAGNCNPNQGWIRRRFYEPFVNGKLPENIKFIRALPHDNPHLTKEKLATYENLPENEYKLYVEGNWDYAEEPDQLINAKWVLDAYTEAA